MFERIKGWFTDASGTESPKSPARDELAKIVNNIETARKVVKGCESRIADLQAIIDAVAAAERELQTLVAGSAGTAGLAAFSTGQDKGQGPVARHVNTADRALQAAEVARRALPAAERDLMAAGREVVRLDEQKKRQIAVIMREHGDVLARRYRAVFLELAEIHDQLVGFARGCGSSGFGSDVIMTSEAIEVPRFNLPALACTADITPSSPGRIGTGGFTPFLRHVPEVQTVGAAALAWSRFAHKLAADPEADASEVFSPELLADVGRHPEHVSSIRSWVRERDEPAMSVNEIQFAPENRERRHIKLA